MLWRLTFQSFLIVSRLIFVACVLFFSSPAHAEREAWIVHQGDVLSRIANAHHVTVTQLVEWNSLENDAIRVGQRLWISPEEPVIEAVVLPDGPRHTYTVLRGDNLSRIAQRVGVPLEWLIAANPNINRQRIRPKQTISVVGATRIVEHQVRPGESLSRLAHRYQVSISDLQAWNTAVRQRSLHAGDTLRIYSDIRISRSLSIGAVNDGHLEHAVTLPEHPGYVIRNREHAYATEETAQWIVEAFQSLREADPHAPQVRIHDLSDQDGGPLSGHRSHQSGRDMDIAYFRKNCRHTSCAFVDTSDETLDVRRQWRLFHYWLEANVIDMIFVDQSLHRALYEEARRSGATAAQLDRWFQYPRGSGHGSGMIRHFPNHRNHAHVRFICPEGDDACESRPQHHE